MTDSAFIKQVLAVFDPENGIIGSGYVELAVRKIVDEYNKNKEQKKYPCADNMRSDHYCYEHERRHL